MTKEQIEQHEESANKYADGITSENDIWWIAKNAFLAGASFASPAVSGQGMKWVKASEMDFPEPYGTNGKLSIRYKGIPDVIRFNGSHWVWDTINMRVRAEHYQDIEWLDEQSTPSDNDFTFPFAKDKNGKWFYSYKDAKGLNQHSKSFDFYNHALEDYSKMRMVDETSTTSGEAEGIPASEYTKVLSLLESSFKQNAQPAKGFFTEDELNDGWRRYKAINEISESTPPVQEAKPLTQEAAHMGEGEYVITSNIRDKTGISLQWLRIWEQVEIWYGDTKKKETGEQFLKRLQATYFVQEGEAVEVLNWLLKQSDEKKIEMCDGNFYYSDDKDGDQPLDEKEVYKLFRGSNHTLQELEATDLVIRLWELKDHITPYNLGEEGKILRIIDKLYSLFKQRPIVKEDTQDELFDELVTKLHNSYNEVELALLKTQYKIIRK